MLEFLPARALFLRETEKFFEKSTITWKKFFYKNTRPKHQTVRIVHLVRNCWNVTSRPEVMALQGPTRRLLIPSQNNEKFCSENESRELWWTELLIQRESREKCGLQIFFSRVLATENDLCGEIIVFEKEQEKHIKNLFRKNSLKDKGTLKKKKKTGQTWLLKTWKPKLKWLK